jgi:hypothetical protein
MLTAKFDAVQFPIPQLLPQDFFGSSGLLSELLSTDFYIF